MLNTHTFVIKFYEGIFHYFSIYCYTMYIFTSLIVFIIISYKLLFSLENEYILMVENTEKYRTKGKKKSFLTPSSSLEIIIHILIYFFQ